MKLIWYGERGVVNAIVTHLSTLPDGAKQFLKCVEWADGSAPAWLDSIDDGNTHCIVELHLAEFGNPDLIIVCQTVSGEKYWVFIEAKVSGYLTSVVPNTLGMNDPAFNSGCNGQLSLKYRFSQALKEWTGVAGEVIEETDSLLQAYQRQPGDGVADRNRSPRKLMNPRILSQILKPMWQPVTDGTKLVDPHFYFVALTRDSQPFFDVAKENLPKLLGDDGQDVFDQWKGQIGWLGYHKLARVPGLREAFEPTLRLMVASLDPDRNLSASSGQTIPNLPRPPAIDALPPAIQNLIGEIDEEIIKVLGPGYLVPRRGSRSIMDVAGAQRVIAKVIPNGTNEAGWRLWFGISPVCGFTPDECVDLPCETWLSHGQNPQVFCFVILPAAPLEAVGVVRLLLERLQFYFDQGLIV